MTLRFDPEDVSKVAVWTLQGKFICLAPVNQRIPANAGKELLRKAMAENKRDAKVRKGYHAVRLRMHEDIPDRMARMDAEGKASQARPPHDATPASLQPIRTPIDGELPALQKALESHSNLRKAVGDGTPHGFEYSIDYMLKAYSRDEDDAPAGFVYQRPALSIEGIIGTPEEGHE